SVTMLCWLPTVTAPEAPPSPPVPPTATEIAALSPAPAKVPAKPALPPPPPIDCARMPLALSPLVARVAAVPVGCRGSSTVPATDALTVTAPLVPPLPAEPPTATLAEPLLIDRLPESAAPPLPPPPPIDCARTPFEPSP